MANRFNDDTKTAKLLEWEIGEHERLAESTQSAKVQRDSLRRLKRLRLALERVQARTSAVTS